MKNVSRLGGMNATSRQDRREADKRRLRKGAFCKSLGKANAMKTQTSSFRGLILRIFVLTLILSSAFAFKATNNAAAVQPAQKKEAAPLIIKDIRFELEKGGKEIVLIYSNQYFEPTVFSLDGKRPRLVIDIKNSTAYKKGPPKIIVTGKLIKQIRSHFNSKSKTLRVVLDLHLFPNYIISQFFFKADNIYAVTVENQQEGKEQ